MSYRVMIYREDPETKQVYDYIRTLSDQEVYEFLRYNDYSYRQEDVKLIEIKYYAD